ncbi:hypothetical protein FRC08_005305 [Ceratobasidium sp. 394]|nr:hypothetical protein FRC08_005305 [Ceratobasidium sp. 394]KAG9075974.1 hypothetical protein FS749_012303 [Ceratobasidium sp. UAMH 11750]
MAATANLTTALAPNVCGCSPPTFHKLQLYIIIHLTKAMGADGSATTKVVSYTKVGHLFILDVIVIENIVEQVKTRGVKASDE